jgi:plasmid stabilization system protein ParE
MDSVMKPTTGGVVGLIAGISGSNMRIALEVVRNVLIGSTATASKPTSRADYLFDCLFALRGPRQTEHLIKGLENCFHAELTDRPLHALRVRVMAYLAWTRQSKNNRVYLEDMERVVASFAAWGYPATAVRSAIERLCDTKLIASGAPARGRKRLRLTASGYTHLTLLLENPAYRLAMALVTEWYDHEAVQRFVSRAKSGGGRSGLSFGDIVETRAVDEFVAYLARQIQLEDTILNGDVRVQAHWRSEVLAHSAAILSNDAFAHKTNAEGSRAELRRDGKTPSNGPPPRRKRGSRPSSQLDLLGENKVRPEPLPRLQGTESLCDTVYVPRILWALEYAKILALGPQTAADLARLFSEHGGQMLQDTNVARAFRNVRQSHDAKGLWQCRGRRYVITATGSARLRAMLSEGGAEP